MSRNVLILGASGRFGRAAAEAFAAAGWHVHRFDRRRDVLRAAVQGMDVVVNAWNPPNYSHWATEMIPLHQQVIDALDGSHATVIVPGNVYVFGAATPTPWCETTPHRADNPLGRLRIEVEAAYRASGVRTILLRGGDFLDTAPSAGWFDLMMVKNLRKGRLTYPGALDAPHAWAYLPDMAQAAVALAEQRLNLPTYTDVPFAGYTLTARDLARHLSDIVARPVTPKRMNWLPVRALATVMPSLYGLPEMRYLWSLPHALDGARLSTLAPALETTPVQTALRAAIAHLDLAKN